MLVVIGIILTLMSLAIPAYHAHRQSALVANSQRLVTVLSAAITAYTQRVVSLPDRSQRRLWDFNGDGILDGDPQRDENFAPADRTAAQAAGYVGPLSLLSWTPPEGQVDAQGRIVDAWRHPLRLDFSRERYGADGVGLWSLGRDGVNADGGGDDLRGWDGDHAQ